MARAKAKTGDIEAMVALLDKDAETTVPAEGDAADTYEAMFKNYWLLEVFYALAENGHMDHFEKVTGCFEKVPGCFEKILVCFEKVSGYFLKGTRVF
jgi:hypothetical protein